MLGTDFGKKCIIVQFLGDGKRQKSSQRRVRRDTEKTRKEKTEATEGIGISIGAWDDGVRAWAGNFDDSEAVPQFGF
jgi:hypothetical protein